MRRHSALGLIPLIWGCHRGEGAPLEKVDIVIVGAGPAGLAAALEASEAGDSVLVVDLADEAGGTALKAAAFLFAAGTPYQTELGVDDSPEAALAEWEGITGTSPDDSPWVRPYLEDAPDEVIGWAVSHGAEISGVGSDLDSGSVPRLHVPVGSGPGLISALVADLPADSLLLGTEGTALVIDDGAVVGLAVADAATGEDLGWIQGGATVLATGGFLADRDRIPEIVPAVAVMDEVYVVAGDNARGDGLDWGLDLGAATAPLERIGFYADGPPSYLSDEAHATARLLGVDRTLFVSGEGLRVLSEPTLGSFPAARAVLEDSAGQGWALFDADLATELSFGARADADEQVTLAGLLERGRDAFQADDLDTLAGLIGLDPTTLAATVATYDADVAAGWDSQFQEDMTGRAALATPPYTAVRIVAAAAKNFGGLSTDTAARVLDASGQPIPGLYGAGEVVGMAGGNIGGWGFSGSMGACLYSGRVAGRSAAADLGG